jgi:hypothetical protein
MLKRNLTNAEKAQALRMKEKYPHMTYRAIGRDLNYGTKNLAPILSRFIWTFVPEADGDRDVVHNQTWRRKAIANFDTITAGGKPPSPKKEPAPHVAPEPADDLRPEFDALTDAVEGIGDTVEEVRKQAYFHADVTDYLDTRAQQDDLLRKEIVRVLDRLAKAVEAIPGAIKEAMLAQGRKRTEDFIQTAADAAAVRTREALNQHVKPKQR